jgi:hypothetical protein
VLDLFLGDLAAIQTDSLFLTQRIDERRCIDGHKKEGTCKEDSKEKSPSTEGKEA